ncbi:MAG: DUF4350 domain-containing protein [Polyangiaceae bacterium]|nr:DUF4350 domain-containing protein [Polyangiaceae bacterium]
MVARVIREEQKSRWSRRALWVVLSLALFLITHAAHAAFSLNDTSWEGTSDLLSLAREKLGKQRVELVATLDWGALKPTDGVIVIHPEVDIDYDEASAFMRDGGRIAVLDDHGKGATFLERFQIHRIPAPIRPAIALRQNSSLPIAMPAVQQVAGHEQGRHPVVRDVQQLVTNHPSGFRHPNLTPVLTIPAVGEPDVTLAVTGIIADRGRLFAMGDPSAFINLMLRYPGNRACAEGLIDYLVEDDSWGKRQGRLFIVVNRFKQTGHFGGRSGLAQELEEYWEGFKELLGDTHDDGLPDWLALTLGGLIALSGVVWMGSVATRSYKRLAPRYARETPLVAQGGLAGRAAVLSAPTTHRALAMLELKAALTERLADRLELIQPGTSELLHQLEERGVSAHSLTELRQVLAELGRIENAVVTSQPLRVTAPGVRRMREHITRLLSDVEEQLGRAA